MHPSNIFWNNWKTENSWLQLSVQVIASCRHLLLMHRPSLYVISSHSQILKIGIVKWVKFSKCQGKLVKLDNFYSRQYVYTRKYDIFENRQRDKPLIGNIVRIDDYLLKYLHFIYIFLQLIRLKEGTSLYLCINKYKHEQNLFIHTCLSISFHNGFYQFLQGARKIKFIKG